MSNSREAEERSVIKWLETIGGLNYKFEKDLYESLIKEELSEYLEASERHEQVKEILDLLWVVIGHYANIDYGHKEEMFNEFTMIERGILMPYKFNYHNKHTVSNASLIKAVDLYLEHPTMLNYVYVKNIIFLTVIYKLDCDYEKAWNELCRSNYSKFIPIDSDPTVVTESLMKIDKDRYSPVVATTDTHFIIRDKNTNKLLKPITYSKANMKSVGKPAIM